LTAAPSKTFDHTFIKILVLPVRVIKMHLHCSPIFYNCHAFRQTVTGKMMDAIGARLGMAYSIAARSISIALHTLAMGLSSFSIFVFS
jgi:hypothetical protein